MDYSSLIDLKCLSNMRTKNTDLILDAEMNINTTQHKDFIMKMVFFLNLVL